ncbi:MAG: hypothetical protein ACI8P3_000885 [Saprospiraceae bacterium]|jgi:hypothetical protein
MKAVIFFILKMIMLLVLPFIVLIRGAVYFHSNYSFHPQMAILGGGIVTLLVLIIYFSWFYGRLTGKFGNVESFKFRAFLAAVLVIGYCAHGLFFFSGKNAKTDGVRREYTSLHPILRLSISTILFIDNELILTDASRLPEDYQKMGLSKKGHSLHYKQRNGYAHAFDIRTKGHSEIRNKLLQFYFYSMGLNTLRHGGTEDHLHISLKSHDRPGGI